VGKDCPLLLLLGEDQFNNQGFNDHFTGLVGGNKSVQVVKMILQRTIKCLGWIYWKVYHQPLEIEKVNIVGWFGTVVRKHSKLIALYSEYLENITQFAAGTIVNTLLDIAAAVKWLILFRPKQDQERPLSMKHYQTIDSILKSVQKSYAKKMKKELTDKDIGRAVANRRIPIGGLHTLTKCIYEQMEWVHKLNDSLQASKLTLSKKEYNRFMSLLFAAMYVLSPQGRVGGIDTLRCRQADELLARGFVLSKVFKTQSTYGYQPVTLSKESAIIFKIYLDHVRPQVAKNMHEVKPNDPLWVPYTGEKEIKITKLVKSFFQRHLGLHITTSAIRTLVETKAKDFLDNNSISPSEKEAIAMVNGHSSQMVKAHYLLKDRAKDVHNSRKLFDIIQSQCSEKSISNDGFEWVDETPQAYIDWGTSHPDYGKSGRARWSTAELNYIKRWIIGKVSSRSYHSGRRTLCALMLDDITNGSEHENARHIFHTSHVLNTARLRHGYRVVMGDRPSRYD
jgi:hypothetical protein